MNNIWILFVGIRYRLSLGEMAEWLIAPVLKTGIVLRTIGGSNPSLSNYLLQKLVSFICFFSLILFFIERKARLDGIAEPEPKKSNRIDIENLS